MNLTINEQWKGQKFDLQQVVFCPQFFSIEDPIDFNRLTSIADFCESKIIDKKNPTLMKIAEVGEIKDISNVENIIKNLLVDTFKINTYIFASFNKHGITDTHHDGESVFLIPTYGLVNYIIYEEEKFIKNFQMEKGDLLIIPKKVKHSAIPLSPRIVVSVGIYN